MATPIIGFYDGQCGMCDGATRFAAKRLAQRPEQAGRVGFAKLDGQIAEETFARVAASARTEVEQLEREASTRPLEPRLKAQLARARRRQGQAEDMLAVVHRARAATELPAQERAKLFSTFCLVEEDRRLFLKWDAIRRVLELVGGPWAWVARLGPAESPLLNRGYDWVARHRHRFAPSPQELCPVPQNQEERAMARMFLD